MWLLVVTNSSPPACRIRTGTRGKTTCVSGPNQFTPVHRGSAGGQRNSPTRTAPTSTESEPVVCRTGSLSHRGNGVTVMIVRPSAAGKRPSDVERAPDIFPTSRSCRVPRRPVLRLLSVLTVLAVALLGTGGTANATPAARAATPSAVAEGCGAGVFCAGAATGDITPPVTSPQWAYTARNCGEAVAAETSGYTVDPQNHLEEGAAYLLGGGPSCIGNKVGPDTELYAKTWPPSEGTYGRLQANAY